MPKHLDSLEPTNMSVPSTIFKTVDVVQAERSFRIISANESPNVIFKKKTLSTSISTYTINIY